MPAGRPQHPAAPPSALEVGRLLQSIREGSPDAEARLWEGFRRKVAYFLLRKTNDPDAAQDLGQEVFVALVSAIRAGRLTDAERAASYVFGICSNLVADWWKARARQLPLESAGDPLARDDPEAQAALAESVRYLRQAFRALPRADQQVLTLRFAEGWSYARIGGLLELNEATARQRASRALARLRAALGGRGSSAALLVCHVLG